MPAADPRLGFGSVEAGGGRPPREGGGWGGAVGVGGWVGEVRGEGKGERRPTAAPRHRTRRDMDDIG